MITLTEEQIEAGRDAAMRRDKKWKPTPEAAVDLAHRLWRERGKLGSRVECVEVAKVAGTSHTGIKNRHLMGELGLPTQNVERALAFANGQVTYTRADGSVRRVNDDMDYHSDRSKWQPWEWWSSARSSFDGLAQDFVDALLVDQCPCCGVTFRSNGTGRGDPTSPTLDHLVPGIRGRSNARLLCSGCNQIKQDALPWMIHRVADWMTLTPAEMIERASALPEMERKQLDGGDRRKVMLGNKLRHSKGKGVEFTLTLEDITWSASCPVFGIPFLLPGSAERTARCGSKGGPVWNSPNFDRIDPTKGYIPGNVVLISTLANTIKQDATSPERIRQVADWFDRELAAAPELAALIDQDDARAHWLMAAE